MRYLLSFITLMSAVVLSAQTIPSIVLPEPNIPQIAITNIDTVKYDTGIEATKVLFKDCAELFKDQRSLAYAEKLASTNTSLLKWINIYKTASEYSVVYKEPIKDLLMVSEARVPKNEEELLSLQTNLDLYKKAGFNSVLVTFDTTESITEFSSLLQLISAKGFMIYFAYGGYPDLCISVLRDPDTIYSFISTAAKYSKGIILGWKRTSLHYFTPDPQFTNYIIKAARDVNPNIEIVGESYYGNSFVSQTEHTAVYNNPVNCSATLLVNVGTATRYPKAVLTNIFKDIQSMDRIILITGMRVKRQASESYESVAYRTILHKKSRASTWIKAGCIGAVILHGDFIDHTHESDNLCNIINKEH